MSKFKNMLKISVIKFSKMEKNLRENIKKVLTTSQQKMNLNKIQKIMSKDAILANKGKIAIVAGATVLLITGGLTLTSVPELDNETSQILSTSLVSTASGYDVYFENYLVGSVENAEEVDQLLSEVIGQLNMKNNQVYALPNALEVKTSYDQSADLLDNEAFKTALYKTLERNIDELLVQAFVIEVENGTQVTLDNLEDVKHALTRVTSQYLPEDETYEVTEVDINNDASDAIVIEKVEDAEELALATAQPKIARTSGSGDEAYMSASIEPSPGIENEEVMDETVPDEGVQEVGFVDAVKVSTVFVKQDNIETVDVAVDTLMDFEEEQVIYNIQSGDFPGKIAEDHGMGLSELYALNPDLEENANKIQIGQEITITQPDPNLSVETKERITFEETFETEPLYEYDDTQYTTYSRVKDEGSSGVKEITANIVKVDGIEVDKVIVNELVVEDPTPKVIVKGTLTPPQFINPVPSGTFTSGYGYRWGSMHYGIDLAAPYGNNVRASASGTVEHAGWMSGYGYLVIINHGNGYKTYYGHNSNLYVYVGQYVEQGDAIAAIGSTGNSTGNHCHFEIRYYGEFKNPANYIY
ncbi:peptidoglycan DD-metalloendopeptidase family protein [Vallitalea okinawensis]|uniref:peptidoglycan DD-metalloendopeptidase family protein n=1 Tax=Vallitalea okinawensis TaxID=2078660 RepID=UPI000CFC4223|nr:M23 family metallopeptidase [Vallitalea okinawensis]